MSITHCMPFCRVCAPQRLDVGFHSWTGVLCSMQDFHIVKMPLTEEEIRGTPALRNFSQWLLQPYSAPPQTTDKSG